MTQVTITMTREQLEHITTTLAGVNAVFSHHLPNHKGSEVIKSLLDATSSLRCGRTYSVDITNFAPLSAPNE